MFKLRTRQFLTKGLLLVLVLILALEPALVAAQPMPQPPADPIDRLTASGEVYIDSVSQALTQSLQLMSAVRGIQATPLTQLSETSVIQARAKALTMAEQSAIALGTVEDLAESIEYFGSNLPAAFDVAQRANDGLPLDLQLDLLNTGGLTPDQVDTLQTELQSTVAARLDVATNGLPADIQSQLQAFGFTQTEIDQLASVVATRGLADTSLTTALAQFRATRDELANARTFALILSLQLLSRQIAVRQATGVAPRAVTDAELTELATDELRLLTHVAHLSELWGSDPSLDLGEGEWWFVERYATRTSQRLETLILDSQNLGLIVELFAAHQMRLLALSARSGDAAYVKSELDSMALLLAHLAGDDKFVEQQRQQMSAARKVLARLAALPQLREVVEWGVSEDAQAQTVSVAKDRLETTGVVDLTTQLLAGGISESDEQNNIKGMVFLAGLPFLKQLLVNLAPTISTIIGLFTLDNVGKLLTAMLTGESDDPTLAVVAMAVGILPIFGTAQDLYSLGTDTNIFFKVLALIGIISDLGEYAGYILSLLPGGVALAGAGFLGSASAKVIKFLYKGTHATRFIDLVEKSLTFREIFDVLTDFIKVITGDFIRKGLTSLGDKLDKAIEIILNFFKRFKHWDNFVAFAERVQKRIIGIYDKGADLVGNLLRRGTPLSDEALKVIDEIGDELAEAGIELSDEATEGLNELAKILDGDQLKSLVAGLKTCPIAGAKPIKVLAKPAYGSGCLSGYFEVIRHWDPDSRKGIRTAFEVFDYDPKKVGELLQKFTDPEDLTKGQNLFKIFKNNKTDIVTFQARDWSKWVADVNFDDALEFLERFGDEGLSALNRRTEVFNRTPYDILNKQGPKTIDFPAEFLKLMKSTSKAELEDVKTFINATQDFNFGRLTPHEIYQTRKAFQDIEATHGVKIDFFFAGTPSDTIKEAEKRAEAYGWLIRQPAVTSDPAIVKFFKDNPLLNNKAPRTKIELQIELEKIFPNDKARAKTLAKQMMDNWNTLLDNHRPLAAREFNTFPHQVKISSGAPEIDSFIPKTQWEALVATMDGKDLAEKSDNAEALIRKKLRDIFGPNPDGTEIDVDLYQVLGAKEGWPTPGTHPPPSSVGVLADGSYFHQPFPTSINADWSYAGEPVPSP